MLKIVISALSLAFVVASVAVAQPATNTALSEQGQQLYRDNCTVCHLDSGEGSPPTFPALTGNDRLRDPIRIVKLIRLGQGRMPPFPGLTAGEIASLASYVRSAWANDFPGVTAEEAAAVLEGLQDMGQTASVWDGIFTEAQAKRGQTAYLSACAMCHGRRLNGAPDDPDMPSAPPLARAKFLRDWEGRSLGALFEYMRATMPKGASGSLTDEEYVDVISYMLSVSRMPAGGDDLRPNPQSLARAVIHQQP